jgi:hypothetical protein
VPPAHCLPLCWSSMRSKSGPQANRIGKRKQIRLAGKSSRFRSGRSTGMCLTAIGALNFFVNIGERPSPILGRVERLETQRDALMKLHTYLRAFDPDLARAFARDSKTSPPAVTLERG